MRKPEQYAAAKELYMMGWDQTRIARLVQVTDATLSKWVNADGWREERARKYSINDSISTQLLDLIDYQLAALKKRVEDNKASGELKLLDKGEIDALSKLFAGVKQKDITWTHYVNVCKELAEFVAGKDTDFASTLTEFTDMFLMQKRETLI